MPRGANAGRPRGTIPPGRKRMDTLLPAAWVLPKGAADFPVTTCRIDAAAHGLLVAWTRRKLKREDADVSVILRGLQELIACFVPEASFVTVKRGQDGDPASLAVTFTGDRSSDPGLRARMRAAVSKWLEITFAGESVTDRLRVAEIVMKDGCWRVSSVSGGCRWNKGGTCPEPVDRGLWDALAAHAVSALSGQRLRFQDGRADRWLVPTRPQAGGRTYEGIELMAFPLNGSFEGGFYTEVVTVATASFPGREGVHLIMRVSMRNWGKFNDGGDKGRVLDVFMPGLGAGDYGS